MLYGKSTHEVKALRERYERELKEVTEHYENNGRLLKLGFVITMIMYFIFNKHLYLGDSTTWIYYFTSWHTIADFCLTFIIVCLLAYFLAYVKHQAYIYFGLFGSIAFILVTVIGFALFAEFFSTSASQDIKARLLLNSDKEYQAITSVNTASSTITNPNLANLYGEKAKIQEAMKGCKPKDCDAFNKRIAVVEGKIAGESAATKAALVAKGETDVKLQAMNNNRADKLKADAYNPAIVTVAKLISFGGNYADYIKLATVLVTLFVAICFEILHHFLSKDREKARAALEGLKQELAKLDGHLSTLPTTAGATTVSAADKKDLADKYNNAVNDFNNQLSKEAGAKVESDLPLIRANLDDDNHTNPIGFTAKFNKPDSSVNLRNHVRNNSIADINLDRRSNRYDPSLIAGIVKRNYDDALTLLGAKANPAELASLTAEVKKSFNVQGVAEVIEPKSATAVLGEKFKCLHCGKVTIRNRLDKKFCGDKCRKAYHKFSLK